MAWPSLWRARRTAAPFDLEPQSDCASRSQRSSLAPSLRAAKSAAADNREPNPVGDLVSPYVAEHGRDKWWHSLRRTGYGSCLRSRSSSRAHDALRTTWMSSSIRNRSSRTRKMQVAVARTVQSSVLMSDRCFGASVIGGCDSHGAREHEA